jgi:hypothetical protein
MEATAEEIREEEERSERLGRLVDLVEKAREDGSEIAIRRRKRPVAIITVKPQAMVAPPAPAPIAAPKPTKPKTSPWSVDIFADTNRKK